MSERRIWTKIELIVAFNLYCKTPFGRLHKTNPDVVHIASRFGRTPSAVAMKLVNFASMDPTLKARNIKGLSKTSKLDREIWDEFQCNWEKLAFESQKAYQAICGMEKVVAPTALNKDIEYSPAKTEDVRSVRVRLVQGFFRESVLASYGGQCALCQLSVSELLVASHIIPWSKKVERRADPTNGISLCALHDRAFDRGFIAIDNSYKVLVSRQIKITKPTPLHKIGLMDIEGGSVLLPSRFLPDKSALAYHRDAIFKS